MLRIEFIRNYSENDFRWMPQDNVDAKWALVQVMAWCLTAPRHYLNQCWPRSKASYGTTWPQWINTVLIMSEAMVDLPRYCKWLRIWLMIGNDEVCCRIMSFNLISVLWQDTNWIGFGSCTIKTSCFTVSLNMFGKTNYRHMNYSDKSVLFVEEMESSWFFQHLNQILQYTVRRLSNNSHFPEFPLTSMRGVLYAFAPPGDGCPGGCQGCDRASLWMVGLISMTQDSRYTCAAHVVG